MWRNSVLFALEAGASPLVTIQQCAQGGAEEEKMFTAAFLTVVFLFGATSVELVADRQSTATTQVAHGEGLKINHSTLTVLWGGKPIARLMRDDKGDIVRNPDGHPRFFALAKEPAAVSAPAVSAQVVHGEGLKINHSTLTVLWGGKPVARLMRDDKGDIVRNPDGHPRFFALAKVPPQCRVAVLADEHLNDFVDGSLVRSAHTGEVRYCGLIQATEAASVTRNNGVLVYTRVPSGPLVPPVFVAVIDEDGAPTYLLYSGQ